MLKNTSVILVAFFMLATCGYLLYLNAIPSAQTVDTQQPQNSESTTKKEISETKQPDIEKKVESKLSPTDGIHIMPDETVMTKDGTVVFGANILQNGTIKLEDGTIVTPVMDMRPSTETKPEVVQKPSHVVIDIVGVDFSYDVKQIKVKQGDTVTINFKSDKGFHDWVIDEFASATERVTENDGITSVTFVADEIGTFQYYCSVMNHRQMGMVGYLIVEER
jgi:plastocyanin